MRKAVCRELDRDESRELSSFSLSCTSFMSIDGFLFLGGIRFYMLDLRGIGVVAIREPLLPRLAVSDLSIESVTSKESSYRSLDSVVVPSRCFEPAVGDSELFVLLYMPSTLPSNFDSLRAPPPPLPLPRPGVAPPLSPPLPLFNEPWSLSLLVSRLKVISTSVIFDTSVLCRLIAVESDS